MTTQLIQQAAEIAAVAAIQYMRQHNAAVNVEVLHSHIVSSVADALPAALADAKQAMAANMPEVATATFRASMVIAGANAAKAAMATSN